MNYNKKKHSFSLTKEAQQVLRMLPVGSNQPITSTDISKRTGIDTTTVRNIIRSLIIAYGVPVGTSNKRNATGYYIIETEDEREKTVMNLASRSNEIDKRRSALESIKLNNDWKYLLDENNDDLAV